MSLLRRFSILLMASLLLALAQGEFVELEQFFNARYTANFTKSADNIKYVLPKGTVGRIEETEKFKSGNYGIKIEVTSGPKKGEKVWVHYNANNPNIKLYKDETDLKKGLAQGAPENATVARTTASVQALQVPRSSDQVDARSVVNEVTRTINRGQKAIGQEVPGGPCSTCSVSNVYARDNYQPRQSEDSPTLKAPDRDENRNGIRSYGCRSTSDNNEYCTFSGDREPGLMSFYNRGPNRIVSPGESRSRQWSFHYESNARQDLGIWISDSPNSTVSQTQESFLMLFPRKSLPHLRVSGNRQIVTLPTGETVTYNKTTKEVVGGVFTEDGPLPSGGRSLNPAKVSYHGTGVMVRVDSRGTDPRLQKNGSATVTKQGRTCKVPVKDLWPDQSNNSAAHFRFPTDTAFDSYLKNKCGFGIN